MAVALRVNTVLDTARPELRFLAQRVNPHRVAAEVGPRGTRLTQRNFRQLGQNKDGWPSTHFYGRAAEATNWQEGFGFVIIGVNQIGIRQRLMGGPIRPVNKKALAFPAHPDAYGKLPGEFPNLKFGFAEDPRTGKMRPALVAPRSSGSMLEQVTVKSGKNKGQTKWKKTGDLMSVQALFWLSYGVNQKPNPKVLPSEEEWARTFDQSVDALLRHPERTN